MITELSADNFCDMQGVNENIRFILKKKYHNEKHEYNTWYEKLKHDFNLGDKKDFTTTD